MAIEIVTFIEVAIIFVATLYLLNHYSAKDVQLYVKVLVFISWFLSFVNVVLVPVDVYYTIKNNNDTNSEVTAPGGARHNMKTIWEISYWTSFIFTWLILPIVQEYVDAGDFTPKERLKRSIKINLIFYGVMIAVGVVFIALVSLTGHAGDQNLLQFLITFSNCFGIFLIVICLGYGLVYIPKRYFQQVDKETNLKFYQYQAAVVDEQKNNLQFDLDELIKLIHLLSNRRDISAEFKPLLTAILESIPEQMFRDATQSVSKNNQIIANEYGDLTHDKIVSLNKQVKKKINELRRTENKWEITLQTAFFLEDIMESQHSIDWRIRSAFYIERKGKCGRFTDTLEWIWHVKIEQIFYFIVGFAFVGFSIAVFFAETFTFDNSNFFDFESIIKAGGHSFMKSQFVCLIPLLYMSLCVYSAFFNMKVAGLYGLYPHQQTDAASLVFSALNFARVACPLVFNFLQMLKISGTAFNEVMGRVDFAFSFADYFPLLLVLLILCNAFEVYGRILGWLGLSSFKFSEDFTDERMDEGKKLIYRARNNKERNFLTLNSTNLRNYHTYGSKMKLSDHYTYDLENNRYQSLPSASHSSKRSEAPKPGSMIKLNDKAANALKKAKQGL